MNADIKELLKAKGYNADAMEKDNIPVTEIKELLKTKGYNVDAMEKDGLFAEPNTTIVSQEPIEPGTQENSFGLMGALQGKEQQNPFGDRNPMGDTPKETINPEGTISTLTTGQPEDKQGAGSKFLVDPVTTDIGQAAAGARRSITLSLGKMLEDGLSSAGFDIGHESTENLKKVNKYIEDYNKQHSDEFIHPSTVGSLVSQLFVPMAKTKGVVIATEAFLSALDGIGKNNSYEDVLKDAAIGAAFGAGSMWLFNQIARRVGPLSYGTKILIAKHPELTMEKALEILKGVPKKDQAYVLGQALDDADFLGFFNGAVNRLNDDKLKLKWLAKQRNKSVADIIGDTEKQVTEAKKYYGEMADMLAADSHNTFAFSSIANSLDSLIRRYDSNPKALSIVNNMKADIAAGAGYMNVRTALEFRQDLNYLLNKAKRFKEKEALELLKNSTDKFIRNNLSEEAFAMVEDATKNYTRAMNNRDFIELLDKHTERHITDWIGFKKALKKEKLDSPEVDKAIDVVNVFTKKFKLDKEFRNITKTVGQSDTALSALGARSWVLQHILDPLDTLFVGSTRHKELIIQNELLKSIRKAGEPTDLVKEILKSKKLNETLSKQELQATAAKVEQLLLPHNPDAATSVTLGGNEVRPLYATERGAIGDTPVAPAAREHFMDAVDNRATALPAPREPKVTSPRELDIRATKPISTPRYRALNNLYKAANAIEGTGSGSSGYVEDKELYNAIQQAIDNGYDEFAQLNLAIHRSLDGIYSVQPQNLKRIVERIEPEIRNRATSNASTSPSGNIPAPREPESGPTNSASSTSNIPDVKTFEEAFKLFGKRNGINITRLQKVSTGTIRIHIEGVGYVKFKTRNNKLAFTTLTFRSGSKMGGKFYKTAFDVSKKFNIPYNPGTLTSVNEIRLPINIYKYKQETGYNPLHSQNHLHTLVDDAIGTLNKALKRKGFTKVNDLSDADINTLAPKLGANKNIRTGVNSLKLYRKMSQILASGGTLSLTMLAPLIDAAYNEEEGKEDGSL